MNTKTQPNSVNFIQALQRYGEMIKIEHTVFALPFTLSGFVLASGKSIDGVKLCLVILAFLTARTSAMSLNRAIDANIDSLNPRTSTRAIPSGQIKADTAIQLALLSFVIMLICAYKLNLTCLLLAPVAIAWLTFYSFTKRFTYLCHFVLGISLGGAAMAGYIAISNSLLNLTPWFLALGVSSWVAGFDILYALMDLDFDQKHKIFSLPACFGPDKALSIARFSHMITVLSLVLTGVTANTHWLYYFGVFIVALMLIYEHKLVKPHDLSKINQAFFNINGFVSIISFVFILVDHFYL